MKNFTISWVLKKPKTLRDYTYLNAATYSIFLTEQRWWELNQSPPPWPPHRSFPSTLVLDYMIPLNIGVTRPDISFPVNCLSQFMHAPTDAHWNAVKRVLRYLAGTTDHGIFLKKGSTQQLHAFSDADWAGDADDYISTNGYIVYIGQHPVSWSLKKQKTIARSSTEVEYRSVANTSSELKWICLSSPRARPSHQTSSYNLLRQHRSNVPLCQPCFPF